jgi:hypothetical protein
MSYKISNKRLFLFTYLKLLTSIQELTNEKPQ